MKHGCQCDGCIRARTLHPSTYEPAAKWRASRPIERLRFAVNATSANLLEFSPMARQLYEAALAVIAEAEDA